ncbi:MAG: DUF3291 domain-containing protein [Desulfomonilaceae bacterium]|jgi:hypothetical protein
MPTTPWKKCVDSDPSRTYVVFLTYLPLKRYRTTPRFLFYTAKILVQLSQSNGLVGYSLRAHLFKNSFWTLSAWENESALRDFAFKGFHKGVMKLLRTDMGSTRFVRWTVNGTEIPLSWEDAMRRFKNPS